MTTPYCPQTIHVGWDIDEKPIVEGQACIGSRCAAWAPSYIAAQHGMGSCGLAPNAQRFMDPSRPTTRQTTPKARPSAEAKS